MKITKLGLLALCSLVMTFMSCNGSKENTPSTNESGLKLSNQKLEFAQTGGVQNFKITTADKWAVVSSEDWCTLSSSNGEGEEIVEVTVTKIVEENRGARYATVTVTAGTLMQKLTVFQAANDNFITVNTEAVPEMFVREAQSVDIDVLSNVRFDVSGVPDWITMSAHQQADTTVKPGDDGKALVTTFTLDIAEYKGNGTRSAKITFEQNDTLAGKVTAAPFVLEIVQQGFSERESLIQFYECLNKPNLKGWGTLKPTSEWEGLTFDGSGRVTEIDLSDKNIEATLTREMFLALMGLPNLTSLGLGNNKLSGQLPKEIEHCANLQKLNLRVNELTGNLPSEITKLSKLTYLNLGFNKFDGQVFDLLLQMTWLQAIVINSNSFDGGIAETVGNMVELQSLVCDHNLLSGSLPESLASIESLGVVLSQNKFIGDIPAAYKIKWWNYQSDICPQIGGGLSNCD